MPILAMIETPTAMAIVKTAPEEHDDPDAPLLTSEEKDPKGFFGEQELVLVKQKPITASFRTTLRHLKSRGGVLSYFRGFHILIIYNLIHTSLISTFLRLSQVSHPLARSAVTVAITVLLCRLNATWTQVLISEPSSKRWYQRLPSRKSFKQLALPTFGYAVVREATTIAPLSLAFIFGLVPYIDGTKNAKDLNDKQQGVKSLQSLIVVVVGLLMTAFVLIPTHVAFRRVQASMLPEEEESIVPFDRTFGGKVIPEILGGSGKVSMRDAWKTFDWNARITLFKIYAKVFAMLTALVMGFMLVFALEMRLILGDALDKMVLQASHPGIGA